MNDRQLFYEANIHIQMTNLWLQNIPEHLKLPKTVENKDKSSHCSS